MKTVIQYIYDHWEAFGGVIAAIAAFFGGRKTKKITDRSGELENLQTVRDLEKQIVIDVKGQIQELREINSGLLWMNKMYRGKKLAYFNINDQRVKHFRYSFTRPLKRWSPWRLFYENINFMAGTDDKRYLLKLRFFK